VVNISKIPYSTLQQEILRILCIKANLNQHQLAKYLNVTQAGIIKALPKLKEDNLITANQDRETKRWTINLIDKEYKRTENLKIIYLSQLKSYLEHTNPGSTIILFGSYARGEDSTDSDIDIAIIGRNDKNLDLKHFEKSLGRPININFYGKWEDIHKNLKENLCNGILLTGAIKL
jgi:predicted nucleotidyltransferase